MPAEIESTGADTARECRVGIVIPCFNEAKRLRADAFVAFRNAHPAVLLCFVNDGSTDATAEVLATIEGVSRSGVVVLNSDVNVGKAEAVRLGAQKCLEFPSLDVVGYFDADLSTPLDQLDLLLSEIGRDPGVLMAFGSRVLLLGRHIERRSARHYLGRVFATCASLLLGLPVYDTQCGAKILRRSAAEVVFAAPFAGRWVFDVEVFSRLVGLVGVQLARTVLVEVPLETWCDNGESRIRLRDLFVVPFDLLRIFWRSRALRKASTRG